MEVLTMHRFKTFLSDTRGSSTYVFAIALLPLLGCAGLGVDYSRALQARAILQGAVDSTVIMLAKEAPKNDAAKLTTLAKPYFGGVIAQHPEVVTSGLAVTRTDKLVSLAATGTVNTTFAGMFGWSQWTIDVATEAAYGTKKIELALVLDNTGSMASANKIQELKKASHTLLDILSKTSAIPDQVKVSIVPYTTRVNLGNSYKNETWLTNTPTGSFVSGYTKPATRNAWQGCVADRDSGYNTSTKPVGVLEQSKYPMVNCVDGLVQLMPLTANWSALHQRIDAMNASGMTDITLGAQWGYETLSGEKPFSEHDTGANVERFMILLTDGDNTQDRWGAGNEPRMNKDTQAMCDAIVERGVAESAKKLKIKLYTVLVIAGNEPLLKSCASNPSMFKKVNKASELEAVFRKIAEDIGQIHLTM
jgi:Flp pilus assembly protein TadG